MCTYNCGLYQLSDNLTDLQSRKIPEGLLLTAPSSEAVILRLLMGGLRLKQPSISSKLIIQNKNYTKLPFEASTKLSLSSINNVFCVDLTESEARDSCNKYFLKNRKNTFVHDQILFELTSYFVEEAKSPIAAFVHLYRSLEFMSYSFPMIYASASRDYRGTYTSLKKFMGGDAAGELAFMKNFIRELFKDSRILSYPFDIEVPIDNIEIVRKECEVAFKEQVVCSFEDSTFSIEFQHMMALFITLRNRYFHFLIGSNNNNFISRDYDINELFEAFNPHFINWIAIVFSKIVQHGFDTLIS